MARRLALALVALYLSGCMTVAFAIKRKETRRSEAVCGGIIGDASAAAVASRIQGQFGDEGENPTPNILWWLGGILLVDAVTATMLDHHQQQQQRHQAATQP